MKGEHDDVTALREVRNAISAESASTRRPLPVRVDSVEVEDEESALFRLRVTLPARRALQQWVGASVERGLATGGPTWRAEVFEHSRKGGWLLVHGDVTEPPTTGEATAHPFDFLQAPRTLLESPRLSGALPDFGRLLGAMRNALEGPLGIRGGDSGLPWSGHRAWTHGITRVWGPPGTGKTHTVVEAVKQLLTHPDERVLIVSTTNEATDELAIRLGTHPAGVLRVGGVDVRRFREKGAEGVLPNPEDRWKQLERAQERLRAAQTPRARARARLAITQARRGLPRLQELLHDHSPRCVITTLYGGLLATVSTDMDEFHRHRRAPFTTVIIDEAGLVPRATAAAMGLMAARQLVLVGDPQQLSPICRAERSMEPAVREWLAVSGMDAVSMKTPGTLSLMHQRRMHPDIGAVVSRFQYAHRLQNHRSTFDRPLPAEMGRVARWPRAAWVVLDACAGQDATSVAPARGPARSWVRKAGVDIFGRLLDHHPDLRKLHGLFISPYRGQAAAAQAALEARGLERRWTASTVHAQQGKEADVVVFDLVKHGGWKPAEWKRLVNVALSRARHQLVFMATRQELTQAWLVELKEGLTPCTVDASGGLHQENAPDAQQGLFAATVDTAAELSAASAGPADTPRLRPRPPAKPRSSLGHQIIENRTARRNMTRAQAQLVHRDLNDLGPRLVRGVAGSGKTIVLARWVALELRKHDRRATIVYGNTALEPHLRNLIAQAWRVGEGNRVASPPWDRIELQHLGTLLWEMRRSQGLQQLEGDARYDFASQARELRALDLPRRFGLLYIDEAQDVGHDALDLLISLVEPDAQPDGSELRPVRIFYDNAQNIYRRSTPRWTKFGLDMRGRSAVLRESFRATRPSMELALDVLHHLRPLDADEDFREFIRPRTGPPLLERRTDNGGWRANFCVVQGQPPTVAIHDRHEDELKALVRKVESWRASAVECRDIRVVAPNRRRCEEVVAALKAAGLPAVHLRTTDFVMTVPQVLVATQHSVKGYEAEMVAVVGAHAFCTKTEPLAEGLYVAMTRARTLLHVSACRVGEQHPGAPIVEALQNAQRRLAAR